MAETNGIELRKKKKTEEKPIKFHLSFVLWSNQRQRLVMLTVCKQNLYIFI